MKRFFISLIAIILATVTPITVFADFNIDEVDGTLDAELVFSELMKSDKAQSIVDSANREANSLLQNDLSEEEKYSYESQTFFTIDNTEFYDSEVYYSNISLIALLASDKGLKKYFENNKKNLNYNIYFTDNNGHYAGINVKKQDGEWIVNSNGPSTKDDEQNKNAYLESNLEKDNLTPESIYYANYLAQPFNIKTAAFCFFEDSEPVVFVLSYYENLYNIEQYSLNQFKQLYLKETSLIQRIILETVVFGLLLTVLILVIILIIRRIQFKPKELSEEEIKAYKKKRNKKLVSVIILLLVLILFYIGYSLFGHRAAKPIIYIYPKQETVVNVKLDNDDLITCSYPEYNEKGWTVNAEPDGNLYDLDTNRNLYSLYYEAEMLNPARVTNEGFVVKGEDSAEFLEEKLAVLGLSDREAEEFIIYWLPRLEANKYNYIRFLSEEEISYNMPLNISPKPDTTIRVFMAFKGLDVPIKVEEQELQSAERSGYTVVEWGGTEIK